MAEHLQGYWLTEAEFPELRDLSTFSADWYRKWRELHLGKYPEADVSTRANLDMFVDMAEARENANA